jgi:hypothetical protein
MSVYAVPPEQVTDAAVETAIECIGDTPYPAVVDGDGHVRVMVLESGDEGLALAQKIAEVMS